MGAAEDALRARMTVAETEKRQQEEPLKRQISELWSKIRAEGPTVMQRLERRGYPGGTLGGRAGQEMAMWEVHRFTRCIQDGAEETPLYVYSDGTVEYWAKHDHVIKHLSAESLIDQLSEALASIRNFAR